MNKKIKELVEIALFAALSLVLSFIPIQTANASIDLSIGLLPLMVLSIRRGWRCGVMAGFLWGLLSIIIGKAYFLNVFQVLFEYPLAFSAAGFFGLFSERIQKVLTVENKKGFIPFLLYASFVGAVARWFFHFIAGILFWGSYAPKGTPVVLYSLSVNGISAMANFIMVFIVSALLLKSAPRLFRA